MKIPKTNIDSKCTYCGSTNFGKGCPIGPNGVHVHVDIGGSKCIFCGSTNIGAGCPFNPLGKNHMRGFNYSPLVVESMQNGVIRGLLMKTLNTPVDELPAYQAGLIDSNYNMVRPAGNIVEANMVSSTSLFVNRLIKILGSRKDLINTTQLIESKIPEYTETADELATRYRNELDYKSKIAHIVSSLTEATKLACSNGLAPEDAEKIIAESISGVS